MALILTNHFILQITPEWINAELFIKLCIPHTYIGICISIYVQLQFDEFSAVSYCYKLLQSHTHSHTNQYLEVCTSAKLSCTKLPLCSSLLREDGNPAASVFKPFPKFLEFCLWMFSFWMCPVGTSQEMTMVNLFPSLLQGFNYCLCFRPGCLENLQLDFCISATHTIFIALLHAHQYEDFY